MSMDNTSKKDLKQLAQKFFEWIDTPEGQKALQEFNQRTKEITEALRKARRVDPKTLHKPMDF